MSHAKTCPLPSSLRAGADVQCQADSRWEKVAPRGVNALKGHRLVALGEIRGTGGVDFLWAGISGHGSSLGPEKSVSLLQRYSTSRAFVTRVVGESMNRRIPNGSWCLFRSNPATGRSS